MSRHETLSRFTELLHKFYCLKIETGVKDVFFDYEPLLAIDLMLYCDVRCIIVHICDTIILQDVRTSRGLSLRLSAFRKCI